MKIRVLKSAKADLREGRRFYERNSPGVGIYFLKCIKRDFTSLLVSKGVHERVEGFHQMRAKRFPFAVYYLVNDQFIDIYAVIDCRRDPEWIAKRLSSSRKPS